MQLTKPDGTTLTVTTAAIREAVKTATGHFVRLWDDDRAEDIPITLETHAQVVRFIEGVDAELANMHAPQPEEPRRDSMGAFLESLAPIVREYLAGIVDQQRHWAELTKMHEATLGRPVVLPAAAPVSLANLSKAGSVAIEFTTLDGRKVDTFARNVSCLVHKQNADDWEHTLYLEGGRVSFRVDGPEANALRAGLFEGQVYVPGADPAADPAPAETAEPNSQA